MELIQSQSLHKYWPVLGVKQLSNMSSFYGVNMFSAQTQHAFYVSLCVHSISAGKKFWSTSTVKGPKCWCT